MPDTFDKYLLENDFFEIAIREQEEKDRRRKESSADVVSGGSKAPKTITEQDLAQAESRGYAAGLADGKQQASEQMAADMQTHLAQFVSALQNLEQAKAEHMRQTEARALDLLRKMLHRLFHIAQDKFPEAVLADALHQALQQVASDMPLVLRVHPATLEYAKQHISTSEQLKPFAPNLQWQPDPALAPGDCVVEWETGGIDARLEQTVQKLDDLLASASASVRRTTPEIALAAETPPTVEESAAEPMAAAPEVAPESSPEPTTDAPETQESPPETN